MPRREDEFYAARKEERLGILKSLCPFCGKDDRLYYNEVFKVWRCGWCEASFPIPSGGKPTPTKKIVLQQEQEAHKVKTQSIKYTKKEGKHLRWRGVAVVIRHGKVLLVKDKGIHQYSLPGGGIHKDERPEQAATRELYEETGLKAKKTTRLGTFKGTANRHLAYLIEAEGHVHLGRHGELEKHIWWDMKKPIPVFAHVREILKMLPRKVEDAQ